MKKIDKVLLSARNQDLNSLISNSIYLEKLKLEGKSLEDVINETKGILDLSDDDLVEVSYKDIVTELNKKTNLLIRVNSIIADLVELNIDTNGLEKVEDELAEMVCRTYNISPGELYD